MEREHRPMLTLFSEQVLEEGVELLLDDDAAHHAHVRRARPGDAVRLVDGRGTVARGTLATPDRRRVSIRIAEVSRMPPPVPLEIVVPVADRERMLIAAEKCVELQATAWRPAQFARSRSVSNRGEGEKFRGRLTARMRSALEQCGGAWLPAIHSEADAIDVLRESAGERRFILDSGGRALTTEPLDAAIALVVGPEGGFEASELEAARALGWIPASLGPTTLRFETAVIAAAAVIRATQFGQRRT